MEKEKLYEVILQEGSLIVGLKESEMEELLIELETKSFVKMKDELLRTRDIVRLRVLKEEKVYIFAESDNKPPVVYIDGIKRPVVSMDYRYLTNTDEMGYNEIEIKYVDYSYLNPKEETIVIKNGKEI